jgi:hypothetical protein
MRNAIACLMLAAIPAWAADPPTKPSSTREAVKEAAKPGPSCAECGVVRSVKVIRKEIKPGDTPTNDAKPSGLVATIPLGKEGGKSHTGPSQRIGKEAVSSTETWEVVIRHDDGRMRLLTLQEEPDVREGDRVRLDARGKLERRTD